MKEKSNERALMRAVRKMNHIQGLIDRGHLDRFTIWRLNSVTRRIQKLEMPLRILKIKPAQFIDGGWRLRWAVHGPEAEVQKFCTKEEAKLYANIRKECEDEMQALAEYWSASRRSDIKPQQQL